MLIPVILSGGNGSRLWPVSREAHPKPFIRLNNESYSLIQKTYQRAANIPNVEKIITVTNFEYYYQTKKELNDLAFPTLSKKEFSFILEPLSRNTTAAIAFSALFLKELIGPDTVLLVLPADHIIVHQDKFNQSVEKAYRLAEKGWLTTFGVIPHKAEIAYGYIQYGDFIEKESAYKVINFQEKPNLKEAKLFVEKGNYLWNSGIFCFKIKTFLNSLKEYTPKLYLQILDCWKLSTKKNIFKDKLKLDEHSFTQIENVSIDYALMEKAQNIAVIPADFDWSDIGSWDVLNMLIKPEENNNRIVGNAFLKETYNTNIYSENSPNRVIGVLGIKNLTIIDTRDALLICESNHIQNVKQLVEELKINGHEAYRYHQTVNRPWGHYTILDQGPNYKLKRLIVHAGASLSLQMHQYRSEYWVVVSGTATVENNRKKIILKKQEATFIPLGHKHCLSNLENQDLVLIELQVGNYLGEDDIIRFKDNYDREITVLENPTTVI